MKGGGHHWPAPMPFPSDGRTPTPPADDRHSRRWCARNVAKRLGSATREAQWSSAPERQARKSPCPPPDAAGQSVDVGHTKWQAAAESQATCQNTCWECDGGRGRGAITDRMPGTGNPQTRRRTRPDDQPTSWVVSTFDVCSNVAVNSNLSCFLYRGRLKRPHLHCRAEAVV